MSVFPHIDVKLLKAVLSQEVKRGYDNRAVIGGLDRFVQNWISNNYAALKSYPSSDMLKAINLHKLDYANRSPTERKRWIESLVSWLDDLEAHKSLNSKPSETVALKAAKAPGRKDSSTKTHRVDLNLPVTCIRGIGKELSSKLGKLGVYSIEDLLYFFPRRYLDFSQRKTIAQLEIGKEQTVFANIWEARTRVLGSRPCTEVTLGDETGNMRAVWFNQPYLVKQFHTNSRIVLSGRVSQFGFEKVFENPEWELLGDRELMHTGRLVPVYPLTQGVYSRQLRAIIKRTIDMYADNIVDFMPQEVIDRCGLLDLRTAVIQTHYPNDYIICNQARKRLAFDELFLLQLGVLRRKREWQEDQPGHQFKVNIQQVKKFIASLPFVLTGAQQKVLQEIFADLRRDVPMSRLLQGDVGSGKTVVATLAMLVAAENGYQSVLMAPTEILAEQHFATMYRLLSYASGAIEQHENIYRFTGFSPFDLKVALLTGSLKPRDKSELHQLMKLGEIDIIIGTHALIQKDVAFSKLGMVIIDEQHRFGVLQRAALRQKGFNPHLLVMTATPIPRTLALTVYGDLDISTINEMPPGRQPIRTRWVRSQNRDMAYNFIREQVIQGSQAFIICPLIEESETLEVRAAVAEYERLSREIFPDLRIGLLHGKMKATDKEAVMHAFKEGKLNILISTSVVEVGIDVPNATVMLVEAADRFGLSQLHQFRGRVGRGEKQSYCLLLSENPSAYGQERLKAIEEISDGFLLAEKDLELRGPGEFFGTRQSGMPDLKMAKLSDIQLVELARREARSIFEKDPNLKSYEYYPLSGRLDKIWQKSVENN